MFQNALVPLLINFFFINKYNNYCLIVHSFSMISEKTTSFLLDYPQILVLSSALWTNQLETMYSKSTSNVLHWR